MFINFLVKTAQNMHFAYYSNMHIVKMLVVNASSNMHIVKMHASKNDSTIFYYNNLLDTVPHTALTVNGARIPVWFLDSDVLSFQLDGALPMSEGITMDNDRLLILFESGADRYRNNDGKNPTDHIWSMEQNERKKQ